MHATPNKMVIKYLVENGNWKLTWPNERVTSMSEGVHSTLTKKNKLIKYPFFFMKIMKVIMLVPLTFKMPSEPCLWQIIMNVSYD